MVSSFFCYCFYFLIEMMANSIRFVSFGVALLATLWCTNAQPILAPPADPAKSVQRYWQMMYLPPSLGGQSQRPGWQHPRTMPMIPPNSNYWVNIWSSHFNPLGQFVESSAAHIICSRMFHVLLKYHVYGTNCKPVCRLILLFRGGTW